MKENLKNFKEYIPLVYIFLVCLGFAGKHHFYNQLNIDIKNYIDIEEYIITFIPLGSIISLILVLIIGYFTIIMNLSKFLKPFKNKKYKTNLSRLRLLVKIEKFDRFVTLFLYYLIVIIPIIAGALLYFFKHSEIYLIIVILISFWCGIIVYIPNSLSLRKLQLKNIFTIQIISMSCFLLVSIWGYQTKETINILSGNSEKYISFNNIKNKIQYIKHIYIGETKKFLFIRNIENTDNIILSKSNVDNIKIFDEK